MPRRIKFLQLNSFYPAYLKDFYAARPGLADRPYAAQIAALEEDGFSVIHTFVQPLRELGFETMHVVLNNTPSQSAWRREAGLPDTTADIVAAQIASFSPDIIYTNLVENFPPDYVRALPERPPVVAGWRGFPIKPETSLAEYDLILTSFDRIFHEARQYGARHVERFHPGFPQSSPVLKEPREIEWDVLISGTVTSAHLHRVQVINMLAEMSTDPVQPFRFGLFMPNASALSPLAQSLNRGARWGNDMLRLLRNARIVVNIDVDAFAGQPPNMRLIEATGVGTCLLTTHHPELRNFFEPGVEVESFRTPQELVAKLMYLLSSPEACDHIAARGQERCLREHNLAKRAEWFANIMRDALARKLPR